MITISLCMIVKNEEKVLKRCLDSVRDLVDEMIIVDTGSTDRTKEIAAVYPGAKIYDFTWVDDFAKARNFAFSKATCDYIYSADADEEINEENRKKFMRLKQVLLPEIEIVQMKYVNQLSYSTVYNYDEEYRPKLFKRVRGFIWEGAIHETVATSPIVYDSDISIQHKPEGLHTGRDFAAFERLIKRGEPLSKRLKNMYAKELFIAGGKEDFQQAADYFEQIADTAEDEEELKEALAVVVAAKRQRKDTDNFFKYALKSVILGGCSEVCFEIGEYYFSKGDYEEAVLWYYNARYETEAILCLKKKEREPLEKLVECCEKLNRPEDAYTYRKELEQL